jgi:hypothetical protein
MLPLVLALLPVATAPALAGGTASPASRPEAEDVVLGGTAPAPRARPGPLELLRSGAAPERSMADSGLAARLASEPRGLRYGSDGSLEAVFGLPPAEARMVFYPVSRSRALPDGYEPTDLVDDLDHPLRALVVGEFRVMFAAAERAGADLEVVSGYRSSAYQALLFERAVQRQLGRDESLSRDEAEDLAARFVAPPGRSQHQLGTTADLSSWEIGYAIRRDFVETLAGRWLAEHAWEYGFILPYTAAAETRTGYVAEPWHVRWVGRPLAALLWEAGYPASGYPTADDWLVALEGLIEGQS